MKYLPYWEMGIEAEGLLEAFAVGGIAPDDRTIDLARDVCMNGFVFDAGAKKWGTPYSTAADLSEHDGVSWGLSEWALPVVSLGLYLARATGDEDWQARCAGMLKTWDLPETGEGWPRLLEFHVWSLTDGDVGSPADILPKST